MLINDLYFNVFPESYLFLSALWPVRDTYLIMGKVWNLSARTPRHAATNGAISLEPPARSGAAAGLVLPDVYIQAMILHPEEIARAAVSGSHTLFDHRRSRLAYRQKARCFRHHHAPETELDSNFNCNAH